MAHRMAWRATSCSIPAFVALAAFSMGSLSACYHSDTSQGRARHDLAACSFDSDVDREALVKAAAGVMPSGLSVESCKSIARSGAAHQRWLLLSAEYGKTGTTSRRLHLECGFHDGDMACPWVMEKIYIRGDGWGPVFVTVPSIAIAARARKLISDLHKHPRDMEIPACGPGEEEIELFKVEEILALSAVAWDWNDDVQRIASSLGGSRVGYFLSFPGPGSKLQKVCWYLLNP